MFTRENDMKRIGLVRSRVNSRLSRIWLGDFDNTKNR